MGLRQIVEASLELKTEVEKLQALQDRRAVLQADLTAVNASISVQQPIVAAKKDLLKTLVNE